MAVETTLRTRLGSALHAAQTWGGPIIIGLFAVALCNAPMIIVQNNFSIDRAIINIDYALVLIFLTRSEISASILLFILIICECFIELSELFRVDLFQSINAVKFGVALGAFKNIYASIAIIFILLCGFLILFIKIMKFFTKKTNAYGIIFSVIIIFVIDVAVGPNRLINSPRALIRFNIAGSSSLRAWDAWRARFNIAEKIRPAQGATSLNWQPTPNRRLLLIIIESWGMPSSRGSHPYMLDSLLTSKVKDQFLYRTGVVAFHNSTSGAELRELCAVRSAFTPSAKINGLGCLPARLAKLGYQTVAFHGYSGGFYDRKSWYPRLGFKRSIFLENIEHDRMMRRCGAAFRGICDVDMAQLIGRSLREEPTKPKLVYWVTLSSHLPVTTEAGAQSNYDCNPLIAAGSGNLCNLFRSWDVTLSAIADMISRPKMPPTDVIIVGDHAPPFVSRDDNVAFSNTMVPWVALTPRHASEAR